MNRREFMAASAATPVVGAFHTADQVREPDIFVVGPVGSLFAGLHLVTTEGIITSDGHDDERVIFHPIA